MDFGAHLPVIDFGYQRYSLERLTTYVQAARDLGFKAVSTNDHLTYSLPWLDAPVALAAILSHSGTMAVGTSVCLPVVRGPVQLAKAMSAIDILSGGRLFVGMGPGSSARDYEIVGINYEDRWKRFDEAIKFLRVIWSGDRTGFNGRFYSAPDIDLQPRPLQHPCPPILIGSWGSEAGLRRVARLGDGWLASGYNTTPQQFADGLSKLQSHLNSAAKDPTTFPNALVTMFMYLTEDKSAAEQMLSGALGRLLNRPSEQLRERLLVGSVVECAEKVARYKAAGVQRLFIWPIKDEIEQLRFFQQRLVPMLDA